MLHALFGDSDYLHCLRINALLFSYSTDAFGLGYHPFCVHPAASGAMWIPRLKCSTFLKTGFNVPMSIMSSYCQFFLVDVNASGSFFSIRGKSAGDTLAT